MPNSPFLPVDDRGRIASGESPPRPEPRRDIRQRAAALIARVRSLFERNVTGHAGTSGDPRSGPRVGRRVGPRVAPPLGRVTLTPAIGIVVAVAVAIAVGLGAGVMVGRGLERRSSAGAAPVTTAPLPLTGGLPLVVGSTGFPGVTGSTPGANLGAPTTTSLLAIHAAGAVVRPGVYLLPPNARVDDVLAAAGGPAADADLDAVNLAEGLADGARVAFPRRGIPVPTVTAPTRASVPAGAVGGLGASTTVAPVDLNAATPTELDALPGVGPATAAAIIEFRTRNGRFRSVSQLLDVPGIGDAKLAALRPRVRV